MQKQEERSKEIIDISTIGHVDHSKATLRDQITKSLSLNNSSVDLRFNPIVSSTEFDPTKEVIERGKMYIKPELVEKWEEFCQGYEYFYSGLFIKRLVNILELLNSGSTIDQLVNYVHNQSLYKELINYICIALVRFSDRGVEFYERLYSEERIADKNGLPYLNETAMCRMLTKKDKND